MSQDGARSVLAQLYIETNKQSVTEVDIAVSVRSIIVTEVKSKVQYMLRSHVCLC